MPSKEVLKAVKNYEDYIAHKGIDEKAVNAYMEACKVAFLKDQDIDYACQISSRTKELINEVIRVSTGGGDFKFVEEWAQKNGQNVTLLNQFYELCKMEAPYRFESYMYYMEKDRPYDKRFYMPRRKTLHTVAMDLQDLEDDKLDIYGLSMPSRVGKSGIMIFFLSWVGLRKPWSHNAMGGHSGQLAKRFFRGLENLIETEDYNYRELFEMTNPTLKRVIERKSSDPSELIINLGKPDEFATFSCRGIDGTWTGAIDVSEDGYLYVDDLVRDREHSMSASRMENTYQEYMNKMRDRCNDGAKVILVGTLWSVLDPLMREEYANRDNPKARFRKIPALNENDESNFQYEYKGFSSEYYINMRERLEKPEWMAKFQQKPFVREGLTFPVEELRKFDGTIPNDKHRTIAVIDPAFGRGDNISMPICKDFGEKQRYIVDWVYDKRTIAYTIPLIVDKISEHMITEITIEKNRGGELFAEKLQDEMDARGVIHCKINLRNAPGGMHKEEKISAYSDFIKRHFIFLTVRKWTEDVDVDYVASEQYKRAIDDLTIFTAEGKNINDDSPDSLAQLAMTFEERTNLRTKIMKCPF